jgi:hypothetical protein
LFPIILQVLNIIIALNPQGRHNPCHSLAEANTLYLDVIVVVNTKYSINRSFKQQQLTTLKIELFFQLGRKKLCLETVF